MSKDDHGEIVEGTFYAEELQKVIKTDDVYKIEPILKKIKYPFLNVRLALLSRTLSPEENLHDFVGPFLPYSLLDTVVGYLESFNSWIFKQDLQKRGVTV
jgi:hypothetical protein